MQGLTSNKSKRSKFKCFIGQKKNYSTVTILQSTWKSRILQPGLRSTGGPRDPGFASDRPAHGSASCGRVWWLPSPTRSALSEKAEKSPILSLREVGSAFFARASEKSIQSVDWVWISAVRFPVLTVRVLVSAVPVPISAVQISVLNCVALKKIDNFLTKPIFLIWNWDPSFHPIVTKQV